MRRAWTGRLHEINITIGPNGRTLRFCKNCGATWELLNLTTHTAFKPVREQDPQGKELEVDVDIRECAVEQPQPVASASVANASVQPVATTPQNLCYCPTCKVKKQHFEGNNNCFCVRCQGQRPHKTAA
jgi:hypothetical protein